jgi:hypothetical protein
MRDTGLALPYARLVDLACAVTLAIFKVVLDQRGSDIFLSFTLFVFLLSLRISKSSSA